MCRERGGPWCCDGAFWSGMKPPDGGGAGLSVALAEGGPCARAADEGETGEVLVVEGCGGCGGG